MGAAFLPPVAISFDEARGAGRPGMDAFFPGQENITGCAVLIVPPDGSAAGDPKGVGVQMARWLNGRGIAGFVLRYQGRPDGNRALVAAAGRAVAYLHTHAGTLGISPRRIGVLGFSGGAEVAGDLAFNPPVQPGVAGSGDPGRPDFAALIWGSGSSVAIAAHAPPAFLVGSTASGGDGAGVVEFWTQLRAAHVPVDAHFFPRADPASGLAASDPSLGAWPGMFQTWLGFSGFLTDAPRVPIKGMVYLDGRILPHGYVIFTPIDFVGAGPVIGRVINSTAGAPLGEFSLPVEQGPVPGLYRVDVRQNMNRWLSNSFSGDLVNVRGTPTPAQSYFGHHRLLAPSIDDQHAYTKVHPADRDDHVVEIKAGADQNLGLKIEVFSR